MPRPVKDNGKERGWRMENFFEMILRTTGAFFTILLLARIIGKKQLSQLTFFHYVTGITVGSTAAEIAAQAETPFFDGLVSLIWWCALTIFVTILTLKSKKARILFDGKPTVLIKDGQILQSALKKERLHIDELTMMLREKEIFSFQDIEYCTLETNGEIGVMKKPTASTVTVSDMKIKTSQPQYLPTEIISNGKIIYENLTELNLDAQWLERKLRKQNIDISQVFFAQVLENGSIYISKK